MTESFSHMCAAASPSMSVAMRPSHRPVRFVLAFFGEDPAKIIEQFWKEHRAATLSSYRCLAMAQCRDVSFARNKVLVTALRTRDHRAGRHGRAEMETTVRADERRMAQAADQGGIETRKHHAQGLENIPVRHGAECRHRDCPRLSQDQEGRDQTPVTAIGWCRCLPVLKSCLEVIRA